MNTNMHKKEYGAVMENPDERMKPSDIAEIMLSFLRLPKQIEISEITINRKKRRS